MTIEIFITALLIFFSLSCSLNLKKRSVASREKSIKISLDTHYHYGFPDGNEKLSNLTKSKLLEFTERHQISRTFLISDAYQVRPEMLSKVNQIVIDMTEEAPDKYIGLCGVDFFEEGALAEALRCLNNKAMKGIKIHMYYAGCFSTDEDKYASKTSSFGKYNPGKNNPYFHLQQATIFVT